MAKDYRTSDGKVFEGGTGWDDDYAKRQAENHQRSLDNKGSGSSGRSLHSYSAAQKEYITLETRGNELKREGKYDEAIKAFSEALRHEVFGIQHSGTYFNRACAYLDKGDYSNAITDYTEAFNRGLEKDFPNVVGEAKEYLARAQMKLGLAYHNGEGVTKDLGEFVKWSRKAAEQGNAQAQSNLGVAYYNGIGIKQDYAEAVKWYRKAAEQGNMDAQSNMGVAYRDGQGVKQDYKESAKWFQKAADQGHAKAKELLAKLKSEGKIK